MKKAWKIIAWLAVACGLVNFVIGWAALIAATNIMGIPTEFWFYDSIGSGIFGLFFLIYSVHSDRKE